MDIKTLLEKMNKFAGEPEQKPGDQVRGTDVAKKSGKGKKHPFLHQLVGDSKKNEFKNKLIKEFAEFKEDEEFGYKKIEPIVTKAKMKFPMANSDNEALALYIADKEEKDVANLERVNDREDHDINDLNKEENSLEQKVKRLEAELHTLINAINSAPIKESSNPEDTVTVDVPLLIRIMEYAREDAKSDIDLHSAAENLINLSKGGRTLSMSDYDSIVGQANEAIDPPSSQGVTTDDEQDGLPGTKPAQPVAPKNPEDLTPAEVAQQKLDQQNLIKNLNQLKTTGVDINPNQAQKAFTKADTGVTLNPTDKDTVSKLAPAMGDIVSNPTLAGQFKTLVQKAQQQTAQQQQQLKK